MGGRWVPLVQRATIRAGTRKIAPGGDVRVKETRLLPHMYRLQPGVSGNFQTATPATLCLLGLQCLGGPQHLGSLPQSC